MLSLAGMHDVRTVNRYRTWFIVLANGAAVLVFLPRAASHLPEVLLMCLGAILGGHVGANQVKHLAPRVARGLVSVLGFSVAIRLFIGG
jgi:uncharacterized membrane protein YfcA